MQETSTVLTSTPSGNECRTSRLKPMPSRCDTTETSTCCDSGVARRLEILENSYSRIWNNPFPDTFVSVNLDTSSVFFFALSAKLIVCLIYTYFLWTDMQMKLQDNVVLYLFYLFLTHSKLEHALPKYTSAPDIIDTS